MTTHGRCRTAEYLAYHGAKIRCTCPRATGYRYYGGRGIEFRFKSFEEFFQEVGLKPDPKYTIERMNSDGHYEKGNVKWATQKEQVLNRRPMKLCREDVLEIRRLRASRVPRKEIALRFKIHPKYVDEIASHRRWAHL
jgi:hypothetical protein